MSVAHSIRQRIRRYRPGEPFTASSFLHMGSRAAVDQELYRLARQGAIKRVSRGAYVKPEVSASFGEIPVSPAKIAKAMAGARGRKLQVSGAEAANRLGLSTQVPVGAVLLTEGPSRTLQIGGRMLVLKHAGKRAMVGAGTKAGPVVSALYYLGKQLAGESVAHALQEKLSSEEKKAVRHVLPQVPAWMAEVLRKAAQEKQKPE